MPRFFLRLKALTRTTRRVAMAVLATSTLAGGSWALAQQTTRVSFPTNLDQLVHYSTVKRGVSTEHMLTSRAALDAVKRGQPVPNGTHVVLVDYRDAKVFRYFVMQKGANWGADYEPKQRTGDWQFQAFTPEKTVNLRENPARCMSCHQSREDDEFLYTFSDMKGHPR